MMLKLKDFNQAKYNPRKISSAQLQALDRSIGTFGDLACVVINKRTNTIVAGHQRLKTLGDKKTKIVTEKHVDDFGTVEQGYILVMRPNGAKFKVSLRIVDWDLRTEKLANIAANNHGGEFDNQKLGKLLAELDKKEFDIETIGFSDGAVQNLIRRSIEAEPEQKYVRKLASPVYEVTGKKPKLADIYDKTKANELKESIAEARLPKDVQEFLMSAAERHTKFNFANIAEYYAHAPKNVQSLMEDCALVIVDHKKAIEHGYLKLTDEIMDMVKNGQK